MPTGPQRVAPLSKQVAKKAPLKPTSRASSQTGIVTDVRPHSTESNLERSKWNVTNRQTKGDWTNG